MRVDLRHLVHRNPSQGNVPCCTASATLLAAEMTLAYHGIKASFSRLFLYYATRKSENRIRGKGARLDTTLETLMKVGVCNEISWPYSPHKIDSEPPASAFAEALGNKMGDYDYVPPSKFKEYLNRKIPIIIGIWTGRLFWRLSGTLESQRYKPVNKSDNRMFRGHAVVIVGYDDDLNGGSWIIANSRGVTWGDGGYAAIPYSCNSDIGESYAIINFSNLDAGEKISKNDK